MIGEIIAIGDELTSGRILNLTSNFAAHHLFAMGHQIAAMATIGDSPELIGSALRRALDRADFIIVTGGLGPTSDDLTNEAVSTALRRPATLHPEILKRINRYLAEKPPNANQGEVTLEKLAWLPAGAEVLKPEATMAGYLLVHEEKPIFFLPGVPHEMKELLIDSVIPRLSQWKGQEPRHVKQQLYRIFGLAETEVNQRVKHFENDNSQVRLGYYPVFPEVHLSLTVLGTDEEEAKHLYQIFDDRIKQALGEHIFAFNEESLADTVGKLLKRAGMSLSLAESCTGGLASHTLTTSPGSSEYFTGGLVAYSNDLKQNILNVSKDTLIKHGAVSRESAIEMASGVRKITKADIGVSITGIAGPSGGTSEKPVGTVFFGLDFKGQCFHFHSLIQGNRKEIQTLASYTALDIVRRELINRTVSTS